MRTAHAVVGIVLSAAGCVDWDNAATACSTDSASCIAAADTGADTDATDVRVCAPNETVCSAAVLKACDADGRSFVTIASCATPELCQISGTTGCVPPTCAAGATSCSGKISRECNGGRTGWSDIETCRIACVGDGVCATVVRATTRDLHTCAFLSDRAVRCWGENDSGQLGIGTSNSGPTTIPKSTGVANAVSIVAGGFHTCALLDDKTVSCWGGNGNGQLGIGLSTNLPTPTPVGLSAVKGIALGDQHTCAWFLDGTMKCWGDNFSGQLGDATNIDSNVPTSVALSGVEQVAAGGEHTCALVTGGTVKCWGRNSRGQLGDNTDTDRNVPTAVVGLPTRVAEIAAGRYHTCAITADNQVLCWGFGIATGSTVDRLTPAYASISAAAHIAAGAEHTCALMTTGGVGCWGSGFWGQLGDGTFADHLDAVFIESGFSQIAAGGYSTCGIKTDGTLKCWGQNTFGELGDGTTEKRGSPTTVNW
jgi:alpha-tubulin suppressor-like RCC1 family protein